MNSPAGFFLRAEAMHAHFGEVDEDPNEAYAWKGQRLNARCHLLRPD